MLKLLVALFAILGLVACHGMLEEDAPVPPGGSNPAPAIRAVDPVIETWFRANLPPGGMRLIAGDRIHIEVKDKPELSVSRDVPPNGVVPILRAGKGAVDVNALGRTTQELEGDIAKLHQEDFVHPYVTVTMEITAPRQIFIYGAVKTPNAYPMSGNDRLTILQAFAVASGTTGQADLRGVTIQRIYPPTGKTVSSPPLDLTLAIEYGDQRDNLNVEPGDIIVVPDLEQSSVQVLGNVEKQGPVPWSRGMTLAAAISGSGGFKRFAKKGAIQIIRHGVEKITIDYDDVIDGKAPDPVLEPRDVIYVPERWM